MSAEEFVLPLAINTMGKGERLGTWGGGGLLVKLSRLL